MNTLSLEKAIDDAGGQVTEQNCPRVIPIDHFHSICQSMDDIGRRFSRILEQKSPDARGAVALTYLTKFECGVMPVKGDGYAVLLSVGMLARIRVMSRILLSYWSAESFVKTIRSPLDKVPSDRDSIPVLLQPLILDEDPPDFWERMFELDQSISLQPDAENHVRELVHGAMLFILSHEFTHILHGHFDLLRRAGEEEFALQFAEIRRGLELDADDGGAAIAMRILFEAINDGDKQGQDVRLDLAWLRLTYAVTMVFAMTDAHRNFFGHYEEGAYNHPMVRCDLFLYSARRCINADKAGMQRWDANSAEGWKRCVMALENFSVDAMTGKFGKLADGVTPGPLHTLSYSATPYGATDQETHKVCREGFKLMWRVRKLLPIFANVSDANPEDPFMQKDMVWEEFEETSIDAEPIFGVIELDRESVLALQDCYGAASVVEYVPVDVRADAEHQDSGDALLEDNQNKAAFFASVNHVVLQLGGIESLSMFTGSLVQVTQGGVATITCIANEETENAWRKQIDKISELTGELSADQWVSRGKLQFLRQFDLSATQEQMARERQGRQEADE